MNSQRSYSRNAARSELTPHLHLKSTFHLTVMDRIGHSVRLGLAFVKELGSGSFGKVREYEIHNVDTHAREMVAIKFPSLASQGLDLRELELLLLVNHRNVCNLKFVYTNEKSTNVLIMEMVAGGDLLHFLQGNFSGAAAPAAGKTRLGILVQLFGYQLFRGLAHCHSVKVCHRDIKPENVLVNPHTGSLKITDFGCGTVLAHENEPHSCYIGTRIFRAPELLLGEGQSHYSFNVDCWAAAIVVSETILGRPIFYKGDGSRGHVLKIFEYVGLPTDDDFDAMRVNRIPLPRTLNFKSYHDTFRPYHAAEDLDVLVDLLKRVFVYNPVQRPSAWELCTHRYFEVLKDPKARLPSGRHLPHLYDFSRQEVKTMPNHVRKVLAP